MPIEVYRVCPFCKRKAKRKHLKPKEKMSLEFLRARAGLAGLHAAAIREKLIAQGDGYRNWWTSKTAEERREQMLNVQALIPGNRGKKAREKLLARGIVVVPKGETVPKPEA